MKSVDPLVVAQEGFEREDLEIRNKILTERCPDCIRKLRLRNVTLSNINIFVITEKNSRYLRGSDVDLVVVAYEPDV